VIFATSALAIDAPAPVAGQSPPTVAEKLEGAAGKVVGNPNANADQDMQRVLDAQAGLNPKPIEELSAEEARKQPSPADGLKALLKKEGKSGEISGVSSQDIRYPGAAGDLPARIYVPEGDQKNLPVVLYFHGGGFVIADVETYDAAPRSIAKLARAVVISADYRLAPEHKFPSAHDDAFAAYKWVIDHAKDYGGDSERIAVMGESAGANLAINVAIAARDSGIQTPVHQVLVYPVAGTDLNTQSYQDNEKAKPLNKAMMAWFFDKVGAPSGPQPKLNLVGDAKLERLPNATMVTAEIDPLRTEGQLLAQKLKDAGVAVELQDFPGAAHEFFGMAAAVKDAAEAQEFVANRLSVAFEQSGPQGQ
jgi:acetyl esterase/lipase